MTYGTRHWEQQFMIYLVDTVTIINNKHLSLQYIVRKQQAHS